MVNGKAELPVERLELRIARVQRGILIMAGVFVALGAASTLLQWLRYADLRASGQAGLFFGLGGGLSIILSTAVAAWILSLQYAARAGRLIREGELVRGKVTGGPDAWGAEVFPPSEVSAWRVLRGGWSALMHACSGIMPTLRMTCELETGGKTHRVHVGLFRDELPMGLAKLSGPELFARGTLVMPEDTPGSDAQVLIFPGKVWKFPSPWAVSFPPSDSGGKRRIEPSRVGNRPETQATPVGV